jgi:tetratricopeptide (TPR) repeat protein
MQKIFVVIFVLMFVAASYAEDKWKKSTFPNFTITGSANEKEQKHVGKKLEQFRETLSVIFPKMTLKSSAPTTVFALKSFKDFQSYLPKEKSSSRIGGFFTETGNSSYIVLPVEDRGRDSDEVMYHEYFHYVTNKNIAKLPICFNEGLAEYFSTFRINDEGKTIELGAPVVARVSELRRNYLIPLSSLLAANSKTPGRLSGIFYAQSWVLVHYLLEGNKKQKAPRFNVLLELLSNDVRPEDAVREAYQISLFQLEKELTDYVRKATYTWSQIKLKENISLENQSNVTVLTEAETLLKRAELMSLSERDDDVEKLLREALTLDENSAEAYRRLGNAMKFKKNYPDAQKYLDKAILLEPKNYLNHYSFALFLETIKKHEDAINAFQEAIKLKDDEARVHASLGSLFQSINRDEEAIKEYKKAVKLDPDDADFSFALSQIYFRNRLNIDAILQARSFIVLEGWSNEQSAYAALIMCFALIRENKPETANKILATALEKIDSEEWVYSVLRYLNGGISEEKLIFTAGKSNDYQTEAYYYIGMNQLIQGKTKEAITNLTWVTNNGNKDFIEYGFAVKELERLNTPPKLPVK